MCPDDPRGNGYDSEHELEEFTENLDTGMPIEELELLRETPAPRFARVVRNKLERKAFAGQVADLTWSAPIQVLVQFLDLLFFLVGWSGTDDSSPSPDRNEETT